MDRGAQIGPPAEALALAIFDIGAVRLGSFRLHAGRTSPIYLDLRLLPSHPAALRQAAGAYAGLLRGLDFELIAAAPLAGLPLGTAVALALDVPLIYPRPAPKAYGAGKRIEGAWRPGQRVVLLDDVITSGASLLEAAGALRAAGLVVLDAAVLVDRGQGGQAALAAEGLALHSALSLAQLLALLEDRGRITAGQRAQVLAAMAAG
ncbi:MAG: orotate phosphoribosyltransferase [Candidatus Promineifilaceae bacterium]